MSSSDDVASRRKVLKVTGGLLSALSMGGVAGASTDGESSKESHDFVEPLANRPDVRSMDAEPLANRPDVRGGPDVEPMANRPDVRSIDAEPLANRPDIRGGPDVEPMANRPDVR